MLRRTLVTLSAAAIAMTGISAAPAAADNDDVARALAAIAGIAVIGTIIHKHNKRDDRAVTRNRPAHQQPQYNTHQRRHPQQVNRQTRRNHGVQPRPLPRRAQKRQLPQHCLRTFNTRQGSYHMFGRRCLQRSNVRIERLPQNCAQRIRTRDGRRSGFEARCMRRSGYSLARR